jgi:hypothetical protein
MGFDDVSLVDVESSLQSDTATMGPTLARGTVCPFWDGAFAFR